MASTDTVVGVQRRARVPPPSSTPPRFAPFLRRRTWLFAAALALGFASLPFTTVMEPAFIVGAGLLAVAAMLAAWRLTYVNSPALETAVPLALVAVVFLLREGTGGLLTTVDFEALFLLPVLWVALQESRIALIGVVVLTAVAFVGSVLIAGDQLGGGEWVKAVLWPAVALLVGLSTQMLVRETMRLSRTDPLTGAGNRVRWGEEFEREMARAQRLGTPLAVAILDLDHFKSVNDSRGHAAGDQILRDNAHAWQSQLRATDLLARFGGEEFAVLLPDTDELGAQLLGERLRQATVGGVTTSVGISCLKPGDLDIDVIKRADKALYRAKRSGRDRVELA